MFTNTVQISSKSAKFRISSRPPVAKQQITTDPRMLLLDEWLQEIPFAPSHYCRASTDKKYFTEVFKVSGNPFNESIFS